MLARARSILRPSVLDLWIPGTGGGGGQRSFNAAARAVDEALVIESVESTMPRMLPVSVARVPSPGAASHIADLSASHITDLLNAAGAAPFGLCRASALETTLQTVSMRASPAHANSECRVLLDLCAVSGRTTTIMEVGPTK